MKELYINIWLYDDKDLIVEHEPCMSLDEAIRDYEEFANSFKYSHTIMIDFEGGLKNTLEIAWSKKINIEDYKRALEQDSDAPEYERLTGHEMGVCLGRV